MTPANNTPQTKSVIAGVAGLATLVLATVSWRSCSEIENNSEIARMIVNDRLAAIKDPERLATAETAEPQLDSASFNSEARQMVELSELTAPQGHKTNTSWSEHEFRSEGTPTNFGLVAFSLTQGRQTNATFGELKDSIRQALKLPISDEAMDRGLSRVNDLLEGVIKDAGMQPDDMQRANALIRAFVDYKLTESLLEARKLWGTRTLADLERLSDADWIYLGQIVERRSSLERMELGIAISNEFVPYMQQLLLLQGNQAIPSWLGTSTPR